VILRTLSKAHALAGARCGAAIACPDLIDVFCRVLPPYSFPTPVIDSVMNALDDEGIGNSTIAIEEIIAERGRVFQDIAGYSCVDHVWPSQANFLLVKFADMADLQNFLLSKRILIRDFSNEPGLLNCARITIGSVDENNALLNALATYSAAG
jgi:histidinol-phosphate aminotransferase